MKSHHTIIAQDPKDFDKKVSQFLNTITGDYSISYSVYVIPMQAKPVNIPGLQMPGGAQQMEIQMITTFSAFIIYIVEQPNQQPKIN